MNKWYLIVCLFIVMIGTVFWNLKSSSDWNDKHTDLARNATKNTARHTLSTNNNTEWQQARNASNNTWQTTAKTAVQNTTDSPTRNATTDNKTELTATHGSNATDSFKNNTSNNAQNKTELQTTEHVHAHAHAHASNSTKNITSDNNNSTELLQTSNTSSSTEKNPTEKNQTSQIVCLGGGFFGQTSNRILTLARALKFARNLTQSNDAVLALIAGWGDLYHEFFDPHDNIIFFPRKNDSCVRSLIGREAYWFIHLDISQELQELVPRRDLRDGAREILKAHFHLSSSTTETEMERKTQQSHEKPLPFISVHRRWLEGACYHFANLRRTVYNRRFLVPHCSTEIITGICDLNYTSFLHLAQKEMHNQSAASIRKSKVILFTDGQVPEKDNTFHMVFNATNVIRNGTFQFKEPFTEASSMLVEMSMMVLSANHIGNPVSTVDRLVNEWRKAMPWWRHLGKDDGSPGVFPKLCFV